MDKRLLRGMMAVLIANIINMAFSVISNFALPKYLSINSYSFIKTFQLYCGYVGIFALGYSDGMYIKYGGCDVDKINRNEISRGLSTLRALMLIETLIFIMVAFILQNRVFTFFVFTLLSANMIGYYKNLFQAIGEFQSYGNILNVAMILRFIVDMTFLFVIKVGNYNYFLLAYVLNDVLIWIVLEYVFSHRYKIKGKGKYLSLSISLLIGNIKTGFLLMAGNFSSILFTGMDRWFIKWKMTNVEFAQYSFAVSLEGFLNIAITPITVTLYNFFCKKQDKHTVAVARKLTLMFSALIIMVAFPAKFVIERYMTAYLGSIQPMFVLFAAQMFFLPNKAIYINLYKAKAQQTLFFKRIILVLFLGFASNYLLFSIFQHQESFAYATMLSACVWLLLGIHDFREFAIAIREMVFIFITIASFLFFGSTMKAVDGFCLYILAIFASMATLFHSDMKIYFQQIKKMKIQ